MTAPETPFADAVDAFLREAPTAFSTPGHKRNPALIGHDPLLGHDAPIHGGADDLRGGKRVRVRAEHLAASAFGADLCRFSGNGSTHPNQALCLAVAGEGEDIEIVEVTLAEAIAMVERGEIVDGKTVLLLRLAQRA